MSKSDEFLVRVKPYNTKLGQLTKSYSWKGLQFREANGWTGPVAKEIADHLKSVIHAKTGGHIFDVISVADKEAQQAEEESARDIGQAKAPTPMARGDLDEYERLSASEDDNDESDAEEEGSSAKKSRPRRKRAASSD